MLRVSDVVTATGGELIFPDSWDNDRQNELSNTYIQGTVMDNRLVEKDYLFVPFIGEKVDAHKYIPAAYEAGAAICFSMRKLQEDVPYIFVKDSGQALKDLATYYRGTLDIPIIGIVGSVGKTSTKEMVAAVLSEKYNVLKTEGNFNNEIGLPLTIMRIRPEHQVAVVEMGISDFDEMNRLSTIARPNYLVMTNIGPCHLEFLHDLDGVLNAKTEAFEHLSNHPKLVLNGDDEKLRSIHHGIPSGTYHAVPEDADIFFFGREDKAVLENNGMPAAAYADNIDDRGLEGIDCDLDLFGENMHIHISLPGQHNINNAMAAAIIGESLGLTSNQIQEGIAKGNTIAGRSNIIRFGDILVIDDCYNAGPVSMKASLGVLASASGRKIAVLGDMGELGEDAPALHSSVGQAVADNKIDLLYTVGSLSEEIHKTATANGVKCIHFDTIEALLPELLQEIKAGDTILIKASHFMNFTQIVKALEDKLQ